MVNLKNVCTILLVSFIMILVGHAGRQGAQAVSPQPALYRETNAKNQYKLFYNQKVKWIDAFQNCKAENSDLLSIDNLAELYYVRGFLNRSGMPYEKGYQVWTSGSNMFNDGHHIWMSNGKGILPTLWSPSQPDNHASNEHCDELWIPDWPKNVGTESIDNYFNYYLNDSPCEYLKNFVCKTRVYY